MSEGDLSSAPDDDLPDDSSDASWIDFLKRVSCARLLQFMVYLHQWMIAFGISAKPSLYIKLIAIYFRPETLAIVLCWHCGILKPSNAQVEESDDDQDDQDDEDDDGYIHIKSFLVKKFHPHAQVNRYIHKCCGNRENGQPFGDFVEIKFHKACTKCERNKHPTVSHAQQLSKHPCPILQRDDNRGEAREIAQCGVVIPKYHTRMVPKDVFPRQTPMKFLEALEYALKQSLHQDSWTWDSSFWLIERRIFFWALRQMISSPKNDFTTDVINQLNESLLLHPRDPFDVPIELRIRKSLYTT